MSRKINLLILIKRFGKKYPKQKGKFDLFEKVEKYANVHYWHRKGDIRDILKQIPFTPDLTFHYDIAYRHRYAPKITGLNKINIPKACLVIDSHYSPEKRRAYINESKIDLIFSATKHPFLKTFPEYKRKFRWLPFSINPNVLKDWKLKKKTRYLLLGQFYHKGFKKKPKQIPPKGRYPFREKVYKKMKNKKGFVFHPHPGHYTRSKRALMNEKYARVINKAEMFFTCGGAFKYPVLKFFEAPACKTLLLAETNPDIRELGFKNGVHYVACTKQDFYKTAKYYHKHKKERKSIAKKGYQFVHKHHTHKVRAKQFIAHIENFLAPN